MKKFVFATLVLGIAVSTNVTAKGGGHSASGGGTSSSSSSHSTGSSHAIRGYSKRNGTYVAPAHATNPNRTKADNYSTRGNVNPYTGKEGAK